MISLDLRGERALITGGSGLLGGAIAQILGECGAELLLHYFQNAQGASKHKKQLEAQGYTVHLVQADLTDFAQVQAIGTQLRKENLLPTIVVANAVIQYQWKTLLEQPLEDFYSQHESCVMQLVHLAKVFGPSMLERKQGRWVVINTECAMQCLETQSAYSSAKRGLDGIVRVLSKEWGASQVTINQVAPGWIQPADLPPGPGSKEYSAQLPLQRRCSPEEVAYAVAFFASPLASGITGTYLPVAAGNVLPGI